MNAQDQSAIGFQLAQSEAAYWLDVDNNWGRTAHEYFVEDGVFDIGLGEESRYVGVDQIRKFYGLREGRGERTAKHLMSNFHVRIDNPREATAFYVLSLFAEDGPPVRESKPAILVVDAVCRMILGQDGKWRIRERLLTPVFMGGVAPTVMKVE